MNQQTTARVERLLSSLPPYQYPLPIAVITPVPGTPLHIAVLGGLGDAAQEPNLILSTLRAALRTNRGNPRLDYIPVNGRSIPGDLAETVGIATAFSFLHIQDSLIIALAAGALSMFTSHVIAILEDRRRCHAFANDVRHLLRAMSTRHLRTCAPDQVTIIPGKNMAFCLLSSEG